MDQSFDRSALPNLFETGFQIRQALELWIFTPIAPALAIAATFWGQQDFECFFEIEDASGYILDLFQCPLAVSWRYVNVGTACDVAHDRSVALDESEMRL